MFLPFNFDFEMCFAPQLRALFRHLNLNFKKVLRDRKFFTLLTSKCASRHKGVHFFNISTSKSALNLVCFAHFDLGMWFVAQQRALFQQLNFKKWRHNGAHFPTSQLPKVLRRCSIFSMWTSKCASRHSDVQFFISHLTRWLRTRRFSAPTFRSSEATKHWKKWEKHSVS